MALGACIFRRLLYDGWPPGGDLSKGTETKMLLVSRLFPKCLLGGSHRLGPVRNTGKVLPPPSWSLPNNCLQKSLELDHFLVTRFKSVFMFLLSESLKGRIPCRTDRK